MHILDKSSFFIYEIAQYKTFEMGTMNDLALKTASKKRENKLHERK